MNSQAMSGETIAAGGGGTDALPMPVVIVLAAVVGLIVGAGLGFWVLRGAAITWDIAAIFCL